MINGLQLSFSPREKALKASVFPQQCDEFFELELIKQEIKNSKHSKYKLDLQALEKLISDLKSAKNVGDNECIEAFVAHALDAEIEISLSEDEMLAHITISGAYGGNNPRLEDFYQQITLNGIVRGVSLKTVKRLAKECVHLSPGESKTEILAKGLPPRKGKDSALCPALESPQQRVLQPKESSDGKVDMRDFGKQICVEAGEPVAHIRAASAGRSGFSITNNKLPAEPGDTLAIELGDNVAIDPNDELVINALINGQPKIEGNKVSVSDALLTDGVNVKTGHIEYKGSVIVNGDVTEHMKIVADGDVTINGYVESASIKSGGDITITKACAGKVENYDCKLIAKGSVAASNLQGTVIKCKKDLHVSKQLAHCIVDCGGKVFVGSNKTANGILFGCEISAGSSVKAGKIGAASGSQLRIDFSQKFEQYTSKLASLKQMKKELASTNADHLLEYGKVKNKGRNASLTKKIEELRLALESEALLLEWLSKIEIETTLALNQFKENAEVIALQKFFPNVEVCLGSHSHKTNRELGKSILFFKNEQWNCKPYKGN